MMSVNCITVTSIIMMTHQCVAKQVETVSWHYQPADSGCRGSSVGRQQRLLAGHVPAFTASSLLLPVSVTALGGRLFSPVVDWQICCSCSCTTAFTAQWVLCALTVWRPVATWARFASRVALHCPAPLGWCAATLAQGEPSLARCCQLQPSSS